MAKIPFNISKNEQYIECHRPFKLPNGKYSGMIRVYELLNPSKANMLTNTMDWSHKPKIVDPNATTGYNSLQIDGQLVDLEKLVQDLCKSRLRVNKLGYCYFQITQGVADTSENYGFSFYRLNDMLRWSDYGVSLKLDKPDASIVWDRLDILHGSTFEAKGIHQKDNIDPSNDQQKTQIQKLTDSLKELELKLDMYTIRQSYVPVTPTLFSILGYSHYPPNKESILQDWEFRLDNISSYTPTCLPVTAESYKYSLSFFGIVGQSFDTSNWYFVGVKELSTPIVVYEGEMHNVRVAGRTVTSPVEGSAHLEYDGKMYWLQPVILVGVGPRISIRHR